MRKVPHGMEPLAAFIREHSLNICDSSVLHGIDRWGSWSFGTWGPPRGLPTYTPPFYPDSFDWKSREGSIRDRERRKSERISLSGKLLQRISFIAFHKVGSTEQHLFMRGEMAKVNRSVDDPLGEVLDPLGTVHGQSPGSLIIMTLRHPIQRFLAGYHQVYVFYQMGWLRFPNKWGITFWNKTCFNTTWGVPAGIGPKLRYPCTGTAPNHNKTALLEAFVDEVERIGFFDDHFAPLTLQMRRMDQIVPINNVVAVDIASMDSVFGNISAMLHPVTLEDQYRPKKKHRMKEVSDATPWIFKLNELEELAGADPGVAALLIRICKLFVNDFVCLPYAMPEKCRGIA